ncbi:MAG: TonB-dependent receptor [Sphingomonadales bacterium]|nr:TonB-dependent receptor [Sphingomonadales bacterium]
MMKGPKFRFLMLAGAAMGAGIALVPMAAQAQQAPAGEQGELSSGDIVVTARKRNETLVSVPVAVSALSAERLTRYNVADLNAVSTLVPNVTIVKAASGTGASMTIRGVGSTFNDFGIDQTVSINIDGIQISRGFITNVAFFDVAQVEVLKGPQALFFGKNSPGGVVSVRSNGPTDRLEAGLKYGHEFVADEDYVEGYISGPLSDTLGGRLAIRYNNMEGWMHNNATEGPNPTDAAFPQRRGNGTRGVSSKTVTGRATLNWKPTSNFTAELKVLGNAYEDNGMSNISQAVRCADGYTKPTDTNLISDPTGDCKADNQISAGGLPVGLEAGYPGGTRKNGQLWSTVDSLLATLRMSLKLDRISFDSVTGYSWGDFKTLSNYGYTSFTRYPGYVTEKSKLFTQELRFNTDLGGPIDFAGGLYYEKSTRDGNIATRFPLGLTPDPVTGATNQTYRYHEIKGEAISGFGQVIWKPVERIEVTGGARYTHETKDTREANTYVDPRVPAAFAILGQGIFLQNRFKDDDISPEVTVAYKPRPDLNLYAAYKTGYKSGGASIPTTITNTLDNNSIGFGPERSRGAELGFKGTLLNRRLTFSTVLYKYKLTGLQLVMPETTAAGLFVNFVRNAADAETKGFEFDTDFAATRELSLQFGLSYNEAKITRFGNAPCWAGQTAATGCRTVTVGTATTRITDRAGDPLSKAPKLVLTGGFNFDHELTPSLGIGFSSQVKYSSSYRTQDDGAPYAFQPAFTTVDASVRLHGIDKRWELSLIGRNLTNNYYLLVTSARPGGLAGELHGVIGRPREVAVQASYKF